MDIRRLQRPQFRSFVVRSTSQPSVETPLQSPKPELQGKEQVPFVQRDVWFARATQGVQVVPQCSGSVCVLTHAFPQSVSGAQIFWHTPPTQAAVPPVGAAHTAQVVVPQPKIESSATHVPLQS